MINWEPFDVDFDDIISGELDTTIRERADGAKALGERLFLDFAAEMNEEEGWGGHDPAKYVAAYRHIHDIFEARGATNVVWAWCPNVTDSPDAPPVMAYYPGDRYVDWTGVDGYNWGTSDPDFRWQSFGQLFSDIYAKLAAKGKPILIGEMASDEVGGSKSIMDRRRRPDTEDRVSTDQGLRVVRHRQGTPLADRLLAVVARGLRAHGERPLPQSMTCSNNSSD